MKFSKSFYIIIGLIIFAFFIFWIVNISDPSTLDLLMYLFFGDWMMVIFTVFLILLILFLLFGFLFRDKFMNKEELEDFNPGNYDNFFLMLKEAYSWKRFFSPVKWKKKQKRNFKKNPITYKEIFRKLL